MKSFSKTFRIEPYEIEAVAIIENGQATSLNFEWSPDLPETLSDQQQAEYRQKRDAVLAALAEEIGTCYPNVVERGP